MFRLNVMSKLIVLSFLIGSHAELSAQALPDSGVSSIRLKTYVEQDKVPLNREVVYQVELSWEGTLNQFEIGSINEPMITNLKLRSSGSSNKFFLDENGKPHSIRRITYYFSPVEIGMAYIDGVIINYEDKLLGQKSSLMAQRLGVEIVDPVPENSEGIVNVSVMLWIITIAFLGLVGFFVYRYGQRRKKEQAEAQQQPRTLEEKYLDLLRDTIHPTSGSPVENLNELVRLVNSYVSEKSGVTGTPNLNEVKSSLQEAGIDDTLISKIDEFYRRSERTRFAGEALSQSDFHLYYDSVELVLKQLSEQNTQDRISETGKKE